METNIPSNHWPHLHQHPNFWPIILIILGALFTLYNFGVLTISMFKVIFKAWPLILVYFGLDMLTKKHPRLRTVSTIIFITLLVFVILLLSEPNTPYLH